jgi:tripartite-type tricarboxylate transporter receptor subunit TctC
MCLKRWLMVLTCLLFGLPVHAEDWPARSITMVVPFAPGGVYDTIGRVYAAALADILATPVVVENVPGAGSMTCSARVARADPDGYQLLLGGESSNAQVQLLHNAPAYDAAKDFAPIALVAQQPLILTVRPGIPAANLGDFVAVRHIRSTHRRLDVSGLLLLRTAIASGLMNSLLTANDDVSKSRRV